MSILMSHVEGECVAILAHLARHGYTTLSRIAEDTGVSFANVQRYLNKECWEKVPELKDVSGSFGARQMAWMTKQRRLNPLLYHRFMQTLRPDPETRGWRFNRSKRDILEHYAHVHHFEILPTKTYPGFRVALPQDWAWNGHNPQDDAFGVISSTR